jgi:Tfp pilus assembly protein PilV
VTTSPQARSEPKGFSLIEVMVAGVVAVVAVLGLAYSFSTGRGLINRYAAARDALAAVEQRMERLSMFALRDSSIADLAPGSHGPFPRSLNDAPVGAERWTVTWVDDPADDAGGDPNPNDYKLVTVEVTWSSGGVQDTVRLSRIVPGS